MVPVSRCIVFALSKAQPQYPPQALADALFMVVDHIQAIRMFGGKRYGLGIEERLQLIPLREKHQNSCG